LDKVRSTVREYVCDNLGDMSFEVASEDIEIGRYDPHSIYSGVTLLNNGMFRYDRTGQLPPPVLVE